MKSAHHKQSFVHPDAGTKEQGENNELLYGCDRAGSPEEHLLAKVESRRIFAALQSLPANQRLAVVLKKFDGLSYNDIGRILGCSSGNLVGLIGVGILEVFHVAAKGSGSGLIPFCHDQFRGNGRRICDNLPAMKGMITTEPTLLPFGCQIPAQGKTVFIFESIRDLIEETIKSRSPV
jgi:hypothetical protein